MEELAQQVKEKNEAAANARYVTHGDKERNERKQNRIKDSADIRNRKRDALLQQKRGNAAKAPPAPPGAGQNQEALSRDEYWEQEKALRTAYHQKMEKEYLEKQAASAAAAAAQPTNAIFTAQDWEHAMLDDTLYFHDTTHGEDMEEEMN